MRSHGGGWHANTAKVCFGLSIIYYLTVVFVSERLPGSFDNLWFMALISAIIILLSPVDSINKPLDGEQRKIEKKKTCRYVVAIYSISLILKWNSLTCYVKEINFALFIVLCSMIFGIVSNTKSNRNKVHLFLIKRQSGSDSYNGSSEPLFLIIHIYDNLI